MLFPYCYVQIYFVAEHQEEHAASSHEGWMWINTYTWTITRTIGMIIFDAIISQIPSSILYRSISFTLDWNWNRMGIRQSMTFHPEGSDFPQEDHNRSTNTFMPHACISLLFVVNIAVRMRRHSGRSVCCGQIFHHVCFNCLHTTPPQAARESDWIWLRFYVPQEGR